jgi:hypothetical protein
VKPFDLEAAMRGEPLVTRSGVSARFIAHVPEAGAPYRVLALIAGRGVPSTHYDDGRLAVNTSVADLFMAKKKRIVYVNIYNVRLISYPANEAASFDSEALARENAHRNSPGLLATAVPIEIEE